jgi:hypothetical protein
VGFLDELKARADAARTNQSIDSAALERNTALADAACKTAFDYFMGLAQQLNVLRPRSKASYRLDHHHVCEDLELRNFRADARRKRQHDTEVFDHVVLRWNAVGDARYSIGKDFPPDIEQLEARLRQGGVVFVPQPVRDLNTSKLREMRYDFAAEFGASALITPEHESGRVRFELRNLDALEIVTVEFAAYEVGNARLDELARWIVGEPNQFLSGGQGLQREPI